MAIPLKFYKSEDSIPWGFRLVGGHDFDQPIVVAKVNQNSVAESFGLEVGDIVVRVNDIPTAGLTHNEVHDLLLSAGCEFELGIRRGEVVSKIISDEDYDIEEANAIKRVIDEEIVNEAIGIVNDMNRLLDTSAERILIGKDENLSEKDVENITTLKSTSDVKKGQKWSTFLIKPDKPVIKPKKKVEEEKPKGEPYRVVIKKQSRRPYQETRSQADNAAVAEIDLETQETEDSNEVIHVESQFENAEVEVNIVENEELKFLETKNDQEFDVESEEPEEYELESQNTGNLMEAEHECPENLKSAENVEITPSLEVQLLAVQKQLQALSQLPSAIQMTLDAVSKQLATIVGAKENTECSGDFTSSSKEEEPETEEEFLEDTSTSEKAEAELLKEGSEANSSVIDELEEDIIRQEGEEIEKDREENVEESELSSYEILTQEEIETRRRNEELEAKREKIMEQRVPKPIQRPIILPGGRKWSIPEDAIPSFRKPKMSEEKIIETIENNLEVIIGKRKGINFLKYEPPAKNLDYLQRSEVYRLVHDMEPPLKGITSRAEKVPAVQDYYEATKETP